MRNLTNPAIPVATLAQSQCEVHALSQQLIHCHEMERAHIARELHDDVQQILYGLSLNMAPSPRMPQQSPSIEEVAQWRQLVEEAMGHLRALTLRLRPAVLQSGGLIAELRSHIDRLAMGESANIQLKVGADIERLPLSTELACYRIIQEALNNSLKHSKASLVTVSVACNDHRMTITIADDGIGFDVAQAGAQAGRTGSMGLMSMRERASIIGGSVEIHSAPGQGATVFASIPMER
jgi:signal transduction histidine kinase